VCDAADLKWKCKVTNTPDKQPLPRSLLASNLLAEILADFVDDRDREAVCRGLATLCPVALPHVWLFSLCSSLNLQSLHQRFSVFVEALTMFVIAHIFFAAVKCAIFYEPSVTGGKKFLVWNSKMREVV